MHLQSILLQVDKWFLNARHRKLFKKSKDGSAAGLLNYNLQLQYTNPAFKKSNHALSIQGNNPYRNSYARKQKKLVPKNTTITDEQSAVLKQWLHENPNNPYPSETEKLSLASRTQLTLLQVNK